MSELMNMFTPAITLILMLIICHAESKMSPKQRLQTNTQEFLVWHNQPTQVHPMTQHSVNEVEKWELSGSSGSFLGSSGAVEVSHDSGSSDVSTFIPVQDDAVVQSAENAGLLLGFDTRLFRNPPIETGKGIAQKLSTRTLESSKNLRQPQSRLPINAEGARSIVRTLSSKLRKFAPSKSVSPKLEDEKSKSSSSFRNISSRLSFRSLLRTRSSAKSKQKKTSSSSSRRSFVKNSPSGRKVCLCRCHKSSSKIPSQKRIPLFKNQTKSKSIPPKSLTANPMENYPTSTQSRTHRPDGRYPHGYSSYHSDSLYRPRPRPHDNSPPPTYPQDPPLGPSRMNYHNFALPASKFGKKLRCLLGRKRRHSYICCVEDSDGSDGDGDNEAPSANSGCFPCCCGENFCGDGGDDNGGDDSDNEQANAGMAECCAWMTGFFTGECTGDCFNQSGNDDIIGWCCDALLAVNCADP